MTRALAASTARTTDSALCGWRLSQITTSPGFSCGTKTCSTSFSNVAVFVARGKTRAPSPPDSRSLQIRGVDGYNAP